MPGIASSQNQTYKYTMPRVKQPRVKAVKQPRVKAVKQPQVKQPRVKQPRVKAIKQLANVKQPSVPDNQKKTCKVVKRRTATGGYWLRSTASATCSEWTLCGKSAAD